MIRYILAAVLATIVTACALDPMTIVEPDAGSGGGAADPSCPPIDNGESERNDAGAACMIVCDDSYKECGGACVTVHDPQTGCSLAACEPCAFLHAFPGCDAYGGCIPVACESGYSDCDGKPANGCEAHTSVDVLNCGHCGHVCTAIDGKPSPVCAMGQCQ